jgi:hypothetical protein
MKKVFALFLAIWAATSFNVAAQVDPPMAGQALPSQTITKTLPPLPQNMPGWITNKKKNHLFYKTGPYNFDIYNIKPLAYDLNAVAVGHAMAYEDMVTGKAETLDTKTFDRINWVLNHPPHHKHNTTPNTFRLQTSQPPHDIELGVAQSSLFSVSLFFFVVC